MIECSSNRIWYKKNRKKRNRSKFLFVFLTLTIIIGVFCYYKFIIVENIYKICSDYAYSYSTEAVNKTIIKSANNNVNYDELITIEKNAQGDIVLISANSYKINSLSREISDKTQSNIKNSLKNGIPIPIMAFSGINILSGYGKNVNFKSIYVTSVDCNFLSNFSSVGINQTLHSIYINVLIKVNLELPFSSKIQDCSTNVLITETVLIGKVPEIYFNGRLFN